MSCRTITLLKVADKLRKHHAELARFYTPDTVQTFEDEWISANNDLENAIARVEVFGDVSILDEALKDHFVAISRIMHKMEVMREDLRVAELMRAFA